MGDQQGFRVREGQNRGLKWVKTFPSPFKSRYRCYFWGKCHMSGGENVKVTHFYISPKFTLFRGNKGAKPGSKWAKTCTSPCKSRYQCYFWGKCYMSGGENVKATPFDISPKFTLFGGIRGLKLESKWVTTCPSPYKTLYKCYL